MYWREPNGLPVVALRMACDDNVALEMSPFGILFNSSRVCLASLSGVVLTFIWSGTHFK